MSTTIEIPKEIWMLIIDHLKMETQLDNKEKMLNKRERALQEQNDTLLEIANKLENNLNETSLLMDNLNQIEGNLLNTLNSI